MGITVDWDDDTKTIVRYTFVSPWTWTEYREAIDKAWGMVDGLDYGTDTITDMSQSRLLPERMFQNVKKSVVEIPDNTQTVVLVGGGTFAQVTVSIIRRVFKKQRDKFFVTNTIEEARELIRKRRAEADAN